jgi:phosphoribosylaminoimidazole-succinocarboxamide synthase
MDTDAIRDQLPRTLTRTDYDDLGERYQGKVRDTYRQNDRLVLVTTDRISAFDHVLRQTIPFKGQVLNQTAAHFFDATQDLVPNHVRSVPDPNVTVARACTPVPLEFVVRGYLEGHAWRVYRDGARTLCGQTLPDGLRQGEQLPRPILTPATKAEEGHDEDITRAEAIGRGLVDADTFDRLEAYALALFERGSEMAAEQGLLLVDTKYEFGRAPDGTLVLIDEVHTPDSSRYYYQEGYEERLERGEPQEQLSKEFVREWLMDHGFQGKAGQELPDLPDDFRVTVAERYIELYERVTGKAFEPDDHDDPETRIHDRLEDAGLTRSEPMR